jgi:hypothetical protein
MKTFEVYIDRTETVLVQALDIDDAKAHALGEEPDAPGCVLGSYGEDTHDINAQEIDEGEIDREALQTDSGTRLDNSERYRAALESIAQDRAVYAPELQNIARRALGLPEFGKAPAPFAQGIAHP